MNPCSPFSYPVKLLGTDDVFDALDAPVAPAWYVDETKMCATGLLATASRDREGDVFEVSGLDTTDHRRNPVVFVDHGLWHRLPIGKTEDENGNYTVVVDGATGDCYQTTYFSQTSQMAEQVFHLCAEKILRANSIGYKPITWKPLPPDPERGVPAGKHLLSTKLIEVTWCGVPMNPDAVMACLSRDKICGKSILPEIKSLLSPYILQKKSQLYIPGKTMDEAPDDDVKDVNTDQDSEKNDAAEPLGKVLLKNMGDGLKAVVEGIEKNLGACEKDKVNKLISKHLESLKGMCTALEDLHKSVYEAIDDAEGGEADDAEPESEGTEDVDDARQEDAGDEEGSKALLKSLLSDKNLTPSQKHILQVAVKTWKVEKVRDDEEYSQEIARLERAIARRVALVANLV